MVDFSATACVVRGPNHASRLASCDDEVGASLPHHRRSHGDALEGLGAAHESELGVASSGSPCLACLACSWLVLY